MYEAVPYSRYVRSSVGRYSTNSDKCWHEYLQILTKTDSFQKVMSIKKKKRSRQAWNAASGAWGYQHILKTTWILINIDYYAILLLNRPLYRALYCPGYCPLLGWIAIVRLMQSTEVKPSHLLQVRSVSRRHLDGGPLGPTSWRFSCFCSRGALSYMQPNTKKYAKSACRTNSGPISFFGFNFIFIKLSILGWIWNSHDITNPFVNCKINLCLWDSFSSNVL